MSSKIGKARGGVPLLSSLEPVEPKVPDLSRAQTESALGDDAMTNHPVRMGEQLSTNHEKPTVPGGPIGIRQEQTPASFLGNNTLIDSDEFARMTGIAPTPQEVAMLQKTVQEVKAKIGLQHDVGFALDCDFCGYTRFAFIGTFQAWDRPKQKIMVGVGVLAQETTHLERFGSVLPSFQKVAEDFLSLNLEEKIEAVLVHEKIELEALKQNRGDPHRYAVAHAPQTAMKISNRTREHLSLYARVDKAYLGDQS